MSTVWSRMREALRSGMRQQITLAGLLYTVTVLVVALGAFASANNLLFLLLAAMLATLLVSNFLSRLSLAGLELDFQLPEHLSARRRSDARVSVINDKWLVPSFAIQLAGIRDTGLTRGVYFPVIPGGATVTEPVEVLFRLRGEYRSNTFRFSSRFPFGFGDRRADVETRRDVLVYPCIDPQPGFEELMASISGDLDTQFRGRGHDFYRIRPYEAFESARHVDWRATAHTGALQVREFAREQDPLVQIYLDLEVPVEQRDWFETAIDCCAFLCWRITRRGSRLHFRTQRLDLRLPEEGDVYTILKYLAVVEPQAGRAAPPHDEHSLHVAFTASPEKMVESGWHGHYLVCPDTLASAIAAAGPAAEDHRHGDRDHRR